MLTKCYGFHAKRHGSFYILRTDLQTHETKYHISLCKLFFVKCVKFFCVFTAVSYV